MQREQPGVTGRRFPTKGKDLPEDVRIAGAFLPDPLPSQVVLPMATATAVGKAQFALGQLREAARRTANGGTVVHLVECTEAQASAGWNGVFVALQEIFQQDDKLGTVAASSDNLPQRLLRAMRAVVPVARKGYSLEMGDVFRFCETVVGEPARLREEPAWLDSPEAKDAFLVLAPPGAELLVAVEQLLSWMDSELEMPIVYKVALGFLQFVLLYPVSGSDHLARLWPALELIRREVLPDLVLPFADWLRRNRDEFQLHILGVVERGDLDAWVIFIASGIEAACRLQLQQIATIDQITDKMHEPFTRRDRLQELISGLFSDPITSNLQVARQLEVSERYARTLTKKLQDAGILEPLDPKRTPTVYVCRPVLQAFGFYHKDQPDSGLRIPPQ